MVVDVDAAAAEKAVVMALTTVAVAAGDVDDDVDEEAVADEEAMMKVKRAQSQARRRPPTQADQPPLTGGMTATSRTRGPSRVVASVLYSRSTAIIACLRIGARPGNLTSRMAVKSLTLQPSTGSSRVTSLHPAASLALAKNNTNTFLTDRTEVSSFPVVVDDDDGS